MQRTSKIRFFFFNPEDRVHTFFQKLITGLFQDSDWFFQGSKIHINPFTPKIAMIILLTVCHTLHIFYWSSTDFKDFPGFQDTYKPCDDFTIFNLLALYIRYLGSQTQSTVIFQSLREQAWPTLFAAMETLSKPLSQSFAS